MLNSTLYKNQNSIIKYPEPNCYSWDYKFFDLDWPLLSELVTKHNAWEILQGKLQTPLSHKFLWEDQETKEKDAAYIKAIREHNQLINTR